MTATDYATRLNKVLDHIDAHLDEPLDLDALAGIAHFSRFHFHRLFAAWFGETLGDYLRRRRLTVAAHRLATRPRMAVLEAAVYVGFGSGEAFARAFKLHFGASPTAWRRQHALVKRNPDQVRARTLRDDGVFPPKESALRSCIVTMLNLPPVRLAYLRHIGPYGPTIGAFWDETFWP